MVPFAKGLPWDSGKRGRKNIEIRVFEGDRKVVSEFRIERKCVLEVSYNDCIERHFEILVYQKVIKMSEKLPEE